MINQPLPSLDQFLATTKPLNPDYTDAEIAQIYSKRYGLPASSAPQNAPPRAIPTEAEFLTTTDPPNPDYPQEPARGLINRPVRLVLNKRRSKVRGKRRLDYRR